MTFPRITKLVTAHYSNFNCMTFNKFWHQIPQEFPRTAFDLNIQVSTFWLQLKFSFLNKQIETNKVECLRMLMESPRQAARSNTRVICWMNFAKAFNRWCRDWLLVRRSKGIRHTKRRWKGRNSNKKVTTLYIMGG